MKPYEWGKWKCRFELFLVVSALEKEEEACRVSTLLYCLGGEAEDVLMSTGIDKESRKKYTYMFWPSLMNTSKLGRM